MDLLAFSGTLDIKDSLDWIPEMRVQMNGNFRSETGEPNSLSLEKWIFILAKQSQRVRDNL